MAARNVLSSEHRLEQRMNVVEWCNKYNQGEYANKDIDQLFLRILS